MNAIKTACDLVGGQTALASMLGVSPQAVWQWAQHPRGAPVNRCHAIERATSGAVTRRDLRPDDWWLIWPELVTAEHPAPTSEAA